MKVASVLLFALALSRPMALAQEDAPASSPIPDTAAPIAASPVAPTPFDGRAYWARFDASQDTRRARLDSVDVRVPKIVTLCLLAPAGVLLVTAAFNALIEWSSGGPLQLVAYEGGSDHHVHFNHQLNPVNAWLAGAGGVLALAAIGTGIWWRRRALERKQVERELDAASSGTPVLALQWRTGAAGLLLRGRY